jgi:2'-5' RNA ligase
MESMNKETALRLFFALWPAEAEQAALAAWQTPLHKICGGRIMRPDTLHATLVFLGEVAADRLESVRVAAQETDFRAFELVLAQAHYWKHNHIVYATPDMIPPPLSELVAGLQRNLRKHRFQFENRPYKPHVTLLRDAQWGRDALPPMPAVRWQVKDFVLVRSMNDGHGARYEALARFTGAAPGLPASV